MGAVYCTIRYWNVFVEIIKEPYISAAAPQGLLLPADLHPGRRVMKQASLEIHHCGEPRRFSPLLSLFLPLLSPFSLFFSFGLLNVLQYIGFKQSIHELTSCQESCHRHHVSLFNSSLSVSTPPVRTGRF